MKRLINLIVLLVAGLFLFGLCELCYAQIDLRYDRRAVEQPDNVIYVGEGLRYSTIEAAVNSAKSGDMIVLHPGTYTDRKVVIDDSIAISFEEGAKWIASDTLCILSGVDGVTFVNPCMESTGDGELIQVDTCDYAMKYGELTFSRFTFADGGSVEFTDMIFLPQEHRKFAIASGYADFMGNTFIGDPAALVEGDSLVFGSYGLLIAGGGVQFWGTTHILADSICLMSTDGTTQFYGPVYMAVSGTQDAPRNCSAVKLTGGGIHFYGGGQITNQDSTGYGASIYIEDPGSVRIQNILKVRNKQKLPDVSTPDSAWAYWSTSTNRSLLFGLHARGGIVPAEVDSIDNNCWPPLRETTKFIRIIDPQNSVADTIPCGAASEYDWDVRITGLLAKCDVQTFQFVLGYMAPTGGDVAVIDTLLLETEGTNCYYKRVLSGFDTSVIPNGYEYWIKTLGTRQPTYLTLRIIYTLANP